MRKLKLDLSKLEVTSFEPDNATTERGTVEGHIPPSFRTDCVPCHTGDAAYTCDFTCPASCYQGCLTRQTAECGGCNIA